MAIWAGIATILASACVITLWVHAPAAAAQRRPAVTIEGCVQLEAAYRHSRGLAMAVESRPDADLVVVESGGAAYVLNGTREGELVAHVGHRVEVNGRIESLSRDEAPAVVPGVTPDGSAAHETADAASAIRVARPVPAAPEPARLNVRSFRPIDGSCDRLPLPPPPAATQGDGDRRGGSAASPEAPPAVRDGARLPPPAPATAHPVGK